MLPPVEARSIFIAVADSSFNQSAAESRSTWEHTTLLQPFASKGSHFQGSGLPLLLILSHPPFASKGRHLQGSGLPLLLILSYISHTIWSYLIHRNYRHFCSSLIKVDMLLDHSQFVYIFLSNKLQHLLYH